MTSRVVAALTGADACWLLPYTYPSAGLQREIIVTKFNDDFFHTLLSRPAYWVGKMIFLE